MPDPDPLPAPAPAVIVCGSAGADDPRLRDQARALVLGGAGPVVTLDVSSLRSVDLRTLDGLARLQLTVRSLGAQLRLRAPTAELRDLLALAGLADVIGDERRY